MGMESQNIIRSSATSSLTPSPDARKRQIQVAKLIDVTCCTGCKGCMDACSEWNNLRGEVGTFEGTYQNRQIQPLKHGPLSTSKKLKKITSSNGYSANTAVCTVLILAV
ncbi:hypothetical protein [Photobacterium leiognathi]|uniref:hypothetical protein n=1 Tax=Photobacterium leiognathi TaxID=553611 RepID=UPI0027393C4A|nr:hypothetical protein [Photobacterium leiognathi]